jgi:hypothetical protein
MRSQIMTDGPSTYSVHDVEDDLEAARRSADRLADFFAVEPEAVRRRATRSLDCLRGTAQPARVGCGLIACCNTDLQRRYHTLLHHEERHPPDGDYGILIAPACQVVEAALGEILTQPARAIVADLIAAMRVQQKDRHQADILAKWGSGQVPTTFGTHGLVLLALRRGCEHRSDAVRKFLASHFRPPYVDLLTDRGLGASLEAIRTRFRNPACHGTTSFDRSAYEEFVGLVVAQQRFGLWDSVGSTPADPAPSAGVFHHHLSQSRRAAVGEANPQRDGMNGLYLKAQRTDLVRPVPAARAANRSPRALRRNLGEVPDDLQHRYRLGDRVCLAVDALEDGHLLLLNLGTGGRTYCLCPSLFAPDTRLRRGQTHYLPQPSSPWPAFSISGATGRENLLAIVTEQPLELGWMSHDRKQPARILTSADVDTLLARLHALGQDRWTAWATFFEVV